ncbi:ABC-three component system protein [Listeria booriae]|uniref:ABC-three component system protein n=1 Tax=Listeria booriae TaxID=1552123 RepID=UPI001624A7C1|nr:ABC-three component system protein [Listeria booriae]MBC1802494.1 hypothetical protein [Listeria booriae]
METKQDKISADTIIAGFDFQYYYYLKCVMEMKENEQVGFEVRDDVHIEKANGEQILIQSKHTVQTNTKGEMINLTNKDVDLWKTISNWIEIVNDENDGRESLDKQLEYIEKTKFILISNKSMPEYKGILDMFSKVSLEEIEIVELKKYISNLIGDGEKKTETNLRIKRFLEQSDSWCKRFVSKLEFELEKTDIIGAIKGAIKEKLVPEQRINHVFRCIDSAMRERNFKNVLGRKKIVISWADFYDNFTKYFEMARSRALPVLKPIEKADLKGDEKSYTFVRQLLDIQELHHSDATYDEDLIDYFTKKNYANLQIQNWIQDSEITSEEKQEMDQKSIAIWKNGFHKHYADVRREVRAKSFEELDGSKIDKIASNLYHEILSEKLEFKDTKLDLELSNGHFYILSDIPNIGWRYNWEELYKGDTL